MDTPERGNPNVCADCIRWSDDAPAARDAHKAGRGELPDATVDSVSVPARRRGTDDDRNLEKHFWITPDAPKD